MRLVYVLIGIAICLLTAWLAVASVREKKARAAILAFAFLISFSGVWFGGLHVVGSSSPWPGVAVGVVVVLVALFFAPMGISAPEGRPEVNERVDERDVIFAREEYQPGTETYAQYYAAHPDKKEIDDKIRSLPELLEPGGRYYDATRSRELESTFEALEALTTAVDGSTNPARMTVDADLMTDTVKSLALSLGADDVGIARLDPMYVYSHVGRGPEAWGAPIENKHQYAIMFALEMDYSQVEAAPDLPITEETAKQYLRGAQLSIALAHFIRSLGYPARAHIAGSNYQIMLPPVACEAGLGELGRMGYLISPRLGGRIRLGAVTTDLPLVADRPISFGVQDFCARCLKCATNCPSGAIPAGTKTMVRGHAKWPLNVERCLSYWRRIGTDCGLCMRVCPYSHPPTFVHNLVRAGVRRSALAQQVAVWGDDLLYGKKVIYPRDAGA